VTIDPVPTGTIDTDPRGSVPSNCLYREAPYDNVGLQDHNRVLKADVTRAPELTNSVRQIKGSCR
jgi:hypothetical protein